jgi:hypothetical protein
MKRLLCMFSVTIAVMLAACGGGGGSPGTGSASGSSSGGTDPLPGTPLADDPIAMVSAATPVNGVIPAGAARNVRATYHGPATQGELLEISVNFAELTYTWTVVQSSFNIVNQTQSGTLTANPAGAGYSMSGGGTLLIMNTGSLFVTGFALVIDGTPISQALFAQPKTGKVITLADIVGTYTFGQFDHEPGERFPFGPGTAAVNWGSARITADGTMHMCLGSEFTPEACTRVKRRTVTFSDGRCPVGLVAVTEGAAFIGCMVVSSNGHDTVLHLDMQTSGASLPGVAFFIRQPAAQYVLADGMYSTVTVANLSPDPDGCSAHPFVVEGLSLTATCGAEGATEQAVFSITNASPLPTNVVGLVIDDQLNAMLLPIADGMWIAVSPTMGWTGDNYGKRGQIRVLIRR